MCINCKNDNLDISAILLHEFKCLLLISILHLDGLRQLEYSEIHSGTDIEYNEESQIREYVNHLFNTDENIPIIKELHEFKCPKTNIPQIKGIQILKCSNCPSIQNIQQLEGFHKSKDYKHSIVLDVH